MKPLSLAKPHLIIMVGIPGAGKTFFAKQFSETFQAPLVSGERVRAMLASLDIDQSTAKKMANAIVDSQLTELFKSQSTILLDGSSSLRTERLDLAKKARANGYEPLLIWVQTEPTTAKTRSTKPSRHDPEKQPISSDEHDAEVRRFKAPSQAEKPIVISGKHTSATQSKIVLKRLAEPRAAIAGHKAAPMRKPLPGRIVIN